MRYGIFSDVHANLEALDAVMDAYSKEDIDRYLCIGDLVGYGADPQACVERVKSFVEITVAGNHDWASVDLFSLNYFNNLAAKAIIWTKSKIDERTGSFLKMLKLSYNNKDLIMVHGTLDKPKAFDYMNDSYTALLTFMTIKNTVCFVGHSHVAGIFIMDKNREVTYSHEPVINLCEGKRYIINVGSVGQPRDGDNRACYCIYDTDKKEVRIKRAKYDIHCAGEKIIEAGLPRFLAERLWLGN